MVYSLELEKVKNWTVNEIKIEYEHMYQMDSLFPDVFQWKHCGWN